MPELIQTLKSFNERERQERKFLAGLKGIDLDSEGEGNGKTFEDVQRKALGIEASGDDIVSLQGQFASQAGFGINEGLGYTKE